VTFIAAKSAGEEPERQAESMKVRVMIGIQRRKLVLSLLPLFLIKESIAC
jgi:hypothetical protein